MKYDNLLTIANSMLLQGKQIRERPSVKKVMEIYGKKNNEKGGNTNGKSVSTK